MSNRLCKAEIQARVPRRTIIVSSILALIIFIGKLITFFGFDTFKTDVWITLSFAIGNLIITVRNPIISLFSHEVNNENRNLKHDIEFRRQKELFEATKCKLERRALLQSETSSTSQNEMVRKRANKMTQTTIFSDV